MTRNLDRGKADGSPQPHRKPTSRCSKAPPSPRQPGTTRQRTSRESIPLNPHGHTAHGSSHSNEKRKSGIKTVGEVTWGSHFCQFYETKEDLLDVLVPYFRAGLEANEFCMWVTSEPLDAEEARDALAAAVPDLRKRIAKGQMEILDYQQWYVLDGKFDADRVLQGWVDRMEAAHKRGFEGLRLTGNTFWLEKSLWKSFSDYEAAVDNIIGKYRMLALCTYSLRKCNAIEVIDVVQNHQFALIRRGKRWEMLQSMQRAAAEAALRQANARLQAQSEQLRAVNDDLDTQTEELATQTEELRAANEELHVQSEELQSQSEELRQAEQTLRQLNEELELRVAARTRDLSKANEALRQAGAYTRGLIEASLDPLVTIGPDGKVTDVNAATEAVTGYTRERLIGTDFADYFMDPAKARAGYQQVFREGFVRDYPLEIRHKNGHVTQVLYNATVYRDKEGNTVGVFAAARDVTELRRAEKAVRVERQRFNDVLEALPAYLVLLAPDHHVPFANRFFRERFGESRGRRCFEYLFHRTEPCEACETYKVLKTNAPHHWEWTGPDERHYDVHDFPFTDIDGSPLILEMGIDITERKRAEAELEKHREHLEELVRERTADLQEANRRLEVQAEELRRAKEHWERTFNSVPDLIAILDDQHHVIQANRPMAERLGTTPERCIGLPCYRAVHGADAPPAFCPHTQTLSDGCEHIVEVHEEHLGGSFLVSTTPLRDERGRRIGSVHVARDITERKQAEEALRRAHEELGAQSEELSAANEELQATNEELREQEQMLQTALETEHRTAERLQLLSDAAANLLAAEDPQGVVNDLCHRVMEYLDCQAFFNFLLDERAGRLRLNACAGIPKEEHKKIEWLNSGVAVCGCVARDGKRIIAEHIPDSDDERTALVKSYGIRAYACHPILAGAKVLGTLSFGTKTRETFAEDEISLMKIVTDLVAIAVQRQQVQQALRESEQRYRSLFEQMNEGFGLHEIVCDDNGQPCDYRFLDVNPAFEQLTGFTRENAVGRLVSEVLPDTEPYWIQTFGRVALTGEPAHLEQYSAALQRYYDAHAYRPAPGQFAVVFTDVTQRRHMDTELRRLNEALEEKVAERTAQLTTTVDRLQDEVVRRVLAESKLRKNSQMLEGFFQHTITPLAFLDRHFNFARVNEAYAQADSKDPQHFVGKNHFELYPHEENRMIFEQVVRTKQPYRVFAKPFAYPDDPQRTTYWNWQLTPLLNDAGEVQSLVLNLQDVTEQQKAYRELEQRTRQLQHLAMELSQAEDRERKRLAEILHDDLQQILAAAKFHLGILTSRIKGEKSAQKLIEQLNEMLKEAIEKSRSLSHELSPAVLYQGDLAETFEWLAQQLQTKHGLSVHVEAHGRVDSPSEAMKPFLYRTAQEMLFNVVKHAKVNEARLRIKRRHGQLRLTISDQGRGFDPKTLNRTAGFGLLSIRERIELLGGRMKIRSVPGRGSTFLIAVPDPQEAEMAEAQTGQGDSPTGMMKRKRPEPKCPERLRVLLVDDHKVMRQGLASLLDEQPDMDVVGQAGNGREAVDLAHKLQPDIIVMDASMPVMAGDEATRQIKLHLPKIRVIGLSMFDEPQMSRRMHLAGAEMYLLKSAPSDELLAAIRGARKAE